MKSFDVDGICLNFVKHAYEWHGKECPKIINDWEDPLVWEMYQNIKDEVKFWETIPALINPKDINVDFDYYLTSIPEKMIEARRINLWKEGFPDKPIIASYDKLQSCRDYGITHHIDDKPSTVKELNEGGVLCIKFVPPYLKQSPTEWDIHDITELKNKWNAKN